MRAGIKNTISFMFFAGLLLAAIGLRPSSSWGECWSNPLRYVPSAKAVVEGRVIGTGDAAPVECKDGVSSFSIEVENVLLGTIDSKILKFSYPCAHGEDDDTFPIDARWIFLVKEVSESGAASLFSYHCRSSVLTVDDPSAVEGLKNQINLIKKRPAGSVSE